jgi:predicted extracellular nuclease
MGEGNRFTGFARNIVDALHSPDVLVLNEIMDNSGSVDDGVVNADKNINKLIAAIQKAGGPAYSFSDIPPINNQDGGVEGGNIRTVLLYRADRDISLVENLTSVKGINYSNGKFKIGQNPLLIGENSTIFAGTRKPRIWLLDQNGRQFFVVGVHLTSQGANSPVWGNQQPPLTPEELRRVEQARLVYEIISEIQLLNPEVPIFIMGDMNDMPWSKTALTLTQDKFTNTNDSSTPEENYSFIFEGNAQALDYIFVNQNLVSNVFQSRFIHVNTYLDKLDAISDHDPVVIEFQLD